MISIQKLTKIYEPDTQKIKALDEVTLEIENGSFVALQGPSGSGKSTLLYTLSGLLKPSSGSVDIDGTVIFDISEKQRSKFRSESIGMIFQNFHLLPYLNVLENIAIPSINKTISHEQALEEAKTLLEKFDLTKRMHHHPAKLSAGECQRVAFARAIINKPKLLLADEPTGNLDNDNTQIALDLLKQYAQQGNTVIMVTHSDQDAAQTNKIYNLKNGKLV